MQDFSHGREDVQSLLTRLGFSGKEIAVYLAILSLKVAPVSTVAKVARQGRGNTYVLLASLERRGLVSRINKNNHQTFVAEPPKRLLQYLAHEEDVLRRIRSVAEGCVPYLQSLSHAFVRQPRVTVSQGFEQMRVLYRECFSHEIIGFFNPKGMYEILGRSSGDMLFEGKLHPRGRELIVTSDAVRRFVESTPRTSDYDYRFLPPEIQFNVDLIVFDETATLFCFDEDLTIVRIDNVNFADTLRGFFALLWTQSTDDPLQATAVKHKR